MSFPSSSTGPSTPTTQSSQAASTTNPSTKQTSNSTNTAADQTNQQNKPMSEPTDPSERSTGNWGKVMNKHWKAATPWSVHKAAMEDHNADALEYYEDRRTGKIEGKTFEEWREPISHEEAVDLYCTETNQVRRVFFAMDYSHGFTGRGVLSESLERPGLVGPRNETVDEVVGPFGESKHEAIDRPHWKASDGTTFAPWLESKDDEDVSLRDEEDIGPLGESRDEEDFNPLEELSDENQDGLSQSHEEEEKVASPEDMNGLLQLAATSVNMMPEVLNNIREVSSSRTTITLPTEPQQPLTSCPPPLALTPSRKRERDSEDDAQDGESPSQQKRMRMDRILGIVRQNVKSAEVSQNAGLHTALDVRRCAKRARSPEEDSEDAVTQPTSKRVRLYLRVKEISGEEEYISAAQKAPTNAGAHEKASMVEEPSTNNEAEESDEGFADDEASANDEASPTETEWDTAHGINSTSANIRTEERILDVNGVWRYLYLPTYIGSPDRAWTEEEKENLRVYIQDYGIQDWELLSQSTNRSVKELQSMYLEVITARNKQAGRPDRAGTTKAYPNLAPPPPPSEPRKLRSPDQKRKTNKNRLGDLTYDLKATSFPTVSKDGRMIDSKGNVLLGVMGDISFATKRRQRKPKSKQNPKQDREQAPAPESASLGPRSAGVCKLSGSSRRGVPRKAAKLRR